MTMHNFNQKKADITTRIAHEHSAKLSLVGFTSDFNGNLKATFHL